MLSEEEFYRQEVIDMTNHLYLRMSESVLSEQEFGIMKKLLLEKQLISFLAKEYKMKEIDIRMLYNNVFLKMKSVMSKNILKDNLIALQEQKIMFLEKEIYLFKKEIEDMVQFYDDKSEAFLNHPSKKKDPPFNFLGNKLE